MRYAVYFAPPAAEPLGAFGAAVLGYDVGSRADVAHPSGLLDLGFDWRQATEAPRRYGFHATLRAPFHLCAGCDEARLLAVAGKFAGSVEPVGLGPLAVTAVDDFIALTPVAVPATLAAFERLLIEAFDPCRAAPDEAELARRRKSGLTAREEQLLARWGYPYVLDEFRFHMTLSGRLPARQRDAAIVALKAAYPIAGVPIELDTIAVCRQPGPEAQFEVVRRFPLGA